ncbi:DUF2867 domain-containing protein [Williamsia sp. 1135]|uniref:DUF2867 domain-containing protein n=1 Tax=Williamsia sp. 1135 TaxID=1889262 RepID=UPI000A102707|nr:DUF2867 domain-containing protein [Williamsia sp. 1135]ORM34112.1 hypothetical protein BFL43_12665 [Williamsia sp. 1135]
MTMRNVHERVIDAPADVVGPLLEDLGQDGDRLWPSPAWVPMKLDRRVGAGADGGHGPIRYQITEFEPGRRVRFEFHERTGVDGFHEFIVEPVGSDRCIARHVMEIRPRGVMRLLFPLAIESMHDAVLEDLLGNLEREATGTVTAPAVWSPWARLCWRLGEQSPVRAVAIPDAAKLMRDVYAHPDLEDAWQVARRPGMSADPQEWADACFRQPPPWVGALFLARNALVRLVGIAPENDAGAAFETAAATAKEVLLGSDASHLDFRASVLVDDETVTVSTVAVAHNARGRWYLSVIAPIHPIVVRGMLRRAFRLMATPRPTPRMAAARAT